MSEMLRFAANGATSNMYKPMSMAPVAFPGSIGTLIEWYDFLIYGSAAALAFNNLFSRSLTRCLARLPHQAPMRLVFSRGRPEACCSDTSAIESAVKPHSCLRCS
jgi:predicted Rossmann-fold nucleotide-binding protein